MLKALIVDDEPAHRIGLSNHLNWLELGYDPPVLAEDGKEALTLARESQIDVLITDICMPEMDGFEVIREIRATHPQIPVLIISGFEEFEFARAAVEAGAQAYLLKPLRPEEIERWLIKFRDDILRRRAIAMEDQRFQTQFQASLAWAREKFLETLLAEKQSNHETAYSQAALLNLPVSGFRYYFLILSLDDYPALFAVRPDTASLIMFRVVNAVQVALKDCGEVIVGRLHPDEAVLCLIYPGEYIPTPEDLHNRLRDVQHTLVLEEELSTSMIISPKGQHWETAYSIYQETQGVLYQRRLLLKGQIILIEETELEEVQYEDHSSIHLQQIYQAFRGGNHQLVLELIKVLFDKLEASDQITFRYVQAISINIAVIAAQVLVENHIVQDGKSVYIFWQPLLECSSTSELREKLNLCLTRMTQSAIEKGQGRKRQIAESIVRYLRDHLSEDINMNNITSVVHFNASYLSVLFKEEMGETISDFLSRIRIERAQQLLRDPQIKIYEVAALAGFQTPSYFSNLFKKATGLTPAEFRERGL